MDAKNCHMCVGVFCIHWRFDVGFQGKTLRIYWHCVLSSAFFFAFYIFNESDGMQDVRCIEASFILLSRKIAYCIQIWSSLCCMDLCLWCGWKSSRFSIFFRILLQKISFLILHKVNGEHRFRIQMKGSCEKNYLVAHPENQISARHTEYNSKTLSFAPVSRLKKGKTIYWMSFSNLRRKI